MTDNHTNAKQVLVISGPTGSGESTITNAIIQKFQNRFTRLVTATTRAPRGNEVNGVEYHFFSKEDFLKLKDEGQILESTYIANRDIYYGTYAPDLENKIQSGLIVIVNPDIVGTRFYKEHYNATTIFILPRDLETLRRRLISRNPDISPEELNQRIENAKHEMETEQPEYDCSVLNEDNKLDQAVEEVVSILRKEGYVLQ